MWTIAENSTNLIKAAARLLKCSGTDESSRWTDESIRTNGECNGGADESSCVTEESISRTDENSRWIDKK